MGGGGGGGQERIGPAPRFPPGAILVAGVGIGQADAIAVALKPRNARALEAYARPSAIPLHRFTANI